ncbi:MAG: hypothetical protein EXR68_02845 [Dehalococcoidia bacterium]|nr:hypothetical protein [Dehalococcoidia bacterium]
MIASAEEPGAYGETLLRPGSPIGAPLLERLASLVLASMVVELQRWTIPWLVDALRSAGFVRATQHAGDLARAVARWLIAAGGAEATAQYFGMTRSLGEAAFTLPGEEMVSAIR